MKIWNEIVKIEEKYRFNSKNEVFEFMYVHRITPCLCEENVFNRTLYTDDLCDKYEGDCYNCLVEYLDLECKNNK